MEFATRLDGNTGLLEVFKSTRLSEVVDLKKPFYSFTLKESEIAVAAYMLYAAKLIPGSSLDDGSSKIFGVGDVAVKRLAHTIITDSNDVNNFNRAFLIAQNVSAALDKALGKGK